MSTPAATPFLIATCKEHGVLAKMPLDWSAQRIKEELQATLNGPDCCRAATIQLSAATPVQVDGAIKAVSVSASEKVEEARQEANRELLLAVGRVAVFAGRDPPTGVSTLADHRRILDESLAQLGARKLNHEAAAERFAEDAKELEDAREAFQLFWKDMGATVPPDDRRVTPEAVDTLRRMLKMTVNAGHEYRALLRTITDTTRTQLKLAGRPEAREVFDAIHALASSHQALWAFRERVLALAGEKV